MRSDSGYEGPDHLNKEKIKPPEDAEWIIKTKDVADSDEYTETVYAVFEVDGETLGMVRLPNPEYLRYLRERMQG